MNSFALKNTFTLRLSKRNHFTWKSTYGLFLPFHHKRLQSTALHCFERSKAGVRHRTSGWLTEWRPFLSYPLANKLYVIPALQQWRPIFGHICFSWKTFRFMFHHASEIENWSECDFQSRFLQRFIFFLMHVLPDILLYCVLYTDFWECPIIFRKAIDSLLTFFYFVMKDHKKNRLVHKPCARVLFLHFIILILNIFCEPWIGHTSVLQCYTLHKKCG